MSPPTCIIRPLLRLIPPVPVQECKSRRTGSPVAAGGSFVRWKVKGGGHASSRSPSSRSPCDAYLQSAACRGHRLLMKSLGYRLLAHLIKKRTPPLIQFVRSCGNRAKCEIWIFYHDHPGEKSVTYINIGIGRWFEPGGLNWHRCFEVTVPLQYNS